MSAALLSDGFCGGATLDLLRGDGLDQGDLAVLDVELHGRPTADPDPPALTLEPGDAQHGEPNHNGVRDSHDHLAGPRPPTPPPRARCCAAGRAESYRRARQPRPPRRRGARRSGEAPRASW